jgi:hypothetical protein
MKNGVTPTHAQAVCPNWIIRARGAEAWDMACPS